VLNLSDIIFLRTAPHNQQQTREQAVLHPKVFALLIDEACIRWQLTIRVFRYLCSKPKAMKNFRGMSTKNRTTRFYLWKRRKKWQPCGAVAAAYSGSQWIKWQEGCNEMYEQKGLNIENRIARSQHFFKG